MPVNKNIKSVYMLLISLLLTPALTFAQANMEPVNELPNPYVTQSGFLKMPVGRNWGSSSTVDIDPDGESIWVAERCGANVGACVAHPNINMIMQFDKNGNIVRSFGAGYISWPHGIDVDHEGNVWIADGRDNSNEDNPPNQIIGHQVHKFSPTGVHLLTLGEPGGAREPDYFFQPNDVHIAPNGNIFVAEGHSNNPEAPARILKFNSQGDFLMTFGSFGDGPGEFIQPHALAIDSKGRLFVADRSNDRIQIFDQDGNFIDMWYQFGRPSGIYIDKYDVLYSADSESGSVNPEHSEWFRGIRIGSAITGEVEFFIPDPDLYCEGTCTAEGVAADHNGVIYGAEVGPVGGIKRYIRERN
ncbi:MAG: peptidyl-alpha-hydroxyglycine alpha-amidating lyase family protein [Pseudohongiellaceae bacterium]